MYSKTSMEVVSEFLFKTQEAVLSSPAASKYATVVPLEPNYYSGNANCQIVSYGNSGNYIYQLRLENLCLCEIVTGQTAATSNTLEYLYVEFFGVHTTEHDGQLVDISFDFVTLLQTMDSFLAAS